MVDPSLSTLTVVRLNGCPVLKVTPTREPYIPSGTGMWYTYNPETLNV